MNEGLEDPRACVNVMSLDFSKAFNRMSHSRCIEVIAAKGASNQTIRSVSGFLSDRQMNIKLKGRFSNTRSTPGGAPQGTKLGNVLFSFSVEDLHLIQANRAEPDVSDVLPDAADVLPDATIDLSAYDRSTDFSMNI